MCDQQRCTNGRRLSVLAVLLLCFSVSHQQKACITPREQRGRCVSIDDCDSIKQYLDGRVLNPDDRTFLESSACSPTRFPGQRPFVCCPTTLKVTTPASTMRPTPKLPPNPTKDECGVTKYYSIIPHILGGNNCSIGEFPWMALMEYENRRGERKFSCGGSLINARYVLTAAHCVIGSVEQVVGRLVGVRLGEHNTDTEIDCEPGEDKPVCADPPIDAGIDRILPHPEYNQQTNANDIALVRLNQTIDFSDFVQPICLPMPEFRSSFTNDKLTVAGFGRTLRGIQSAIKQKLTIKVYDHDSCRNLFATKNAVITTNQICAGGEFAKDSCQGDSGGPLMKFQKVWYLEGVVSYGNRCGLENWPGVYTHVPGYMSWIRSNIVA